MIGGAERVRAREIKDAKNTRPSKSICSKYIGPSKTLKQQAQGLHGSPLGSLCIDYGLFSGFMGFLNVQVSRWVSFLVPSLRLALCFVPFQCIPFCLIIISLYYYLLED